MEIRLAENIRNFRKERALTQEQLSEVLGVTAGAVYKWEAKLSVPELDLIIQMADFFDTSVDVLLGYEIKDNRLEATVKRLNEYRRGKDRSCLNEAEQALKKYPHSFEIVNACASLYNVLGLESGDRALLHRALELLNQALVLLPQNKDPEISEQTIYGRMAHAHLLLDETEKAIQLWKTHNAGGHYNHMIGQVLSQSEHMEEAVPYLSESLATILSNLINTVLGFMNVYYKRGDHVSCQAILQWTVSLLLGLREADKPNYLDKVSAILLTGLAASQFTSGLHDEARDTLVKAKELAAFFDASPSYDESDIRFINRIEGASAHDDLGPTAMEAVGHAVGQFENEEFSALWRSLSKQENQNG